MVSQVEAAVGGWSAGIVEKWPAIEASGSEAIGGGESKAQGGGVEPGAFDQ
jgi:hypothetical protein